jgi:outer membrane protein assembly factor BamB
MSRLLGGLLLLAAWTGPAWGADWSEFRGPTGQGVSDVKGLPVRWNETKNVRWKVKLPGYGWSSPIVVNERIYLTTAQPTGGDWSLRALCLDPADGSVVWNKEVFRQEARSRGSRIHQKNSHASPTPLSDGEHVFVHFGTHGTACLTLDGDVVWRCRSLVYAPNHGNGGSPVLVEGVLVVLCDGTDIQFAAGIDAKTGKEIWRTRRYPPTAKKFSFATPLAIQVGSKTQVVSPGTDAVMAYEPKTGKEIWKVRYEGYSVVPRPVFGNGLVYVCTGFNRASLLAIKPTGTGDVTDTHVVWKTDRAVSLTPSPVLDGRELYFISDHGVASCLDALTGRQHWQQRIGGKFSASPLLAGGRIYFQSERGETVVIKASKEYEEIARNHVGAGSEPPETLASFAVIGSAILLRTKEDLYRIESK